jgi:hypothetical protein
VIGATQFRVTLRKAAHRGRSDCSPWEARRPDSGAQMYVVRENVKEKEKEAVAGGN